MTEMFPHQTEGALRLASGVPTYLALDMGIGKSRTFIEAVKLRKAERALIICPASAVLVWKREIELWDPHATYRVVRNAGDLRSPGAEYYIVTHGLMSQRNGPIPDALVKGKPFEMTALDEAHAFNSPDTNRVKALRRAALVFKLGQIVPLSGTPMRNHAGDLYNLLNLCCPAFRMTRYDYEETFCRVTHKTFGGSRMIRVIEGSKNLEKLRTMIAPFMMRVRKEDVFADLPPILWDSVPIPLDSGMMLPPDLARLENAINRSSTLGTPEEDLTEALRRAANDVGLMEIRRMLGIAKLRGATEYLVDMLDNLPEHRKVLVFAHHAHVIAALARHLGEYSPAVLTGVSRPVDREFAVNKFLFDRTCRVFIGNIQAAGTAITLVGPKCRCSDVVFVESSWTPMDNAQAACRVHRIGQKDGVVARMLSAAGTVDDLINSLLVRKACEFTQLFDSNNKETT